MGSRMFPKDQTLRLAGFQIDNYVEMIPKSKRFTGIFGHLAELLDSWFTGPGINRTLLLNKVSVSCHNILTLIDFEIFP